MNNPLSLMAHKGEQRNHAGIAIVNTAPQMISARQVSHFRASNRVCGESAIGGFTLFERVVLVDILGILMLVMIPGYNQYLIRSNKSAAKATLFDVSSRQEQNLMTASSFGTLAQLNYTVSTEVSNYFDITLIPGKLDQHRHLERKPDRPAGIRLAKSTLYLSTRKVVSRWILKSRRWWHGNGNTVASLLVPDPVSAR